MNNIDNKKLNELLKMTAQKLGTTPDGLKNAAQNGDMGKILSSAQNESIKQVLSDPEKAKRLLSSDHAKKLMEALGLKNENEGK